MVVQPQDPDVVSSPVLVADLGALSSLAMRVLNAHTNQAGRCAACGSGRPCEQASLAEHNLAAAL
jgi:hypothetical protein